MRTFLVIIFMPVILLARGATVTGRLVDANAMPVAGANIFLEGTVLGGASDDNGVFRVTNIPAGNFILKITMIGFEQKELMIATSDTSRINLGQINLTEAPLQTQPIVVTASKYEQNLQDVPVSISTVTAQEINYRNSTTVDEALKYVSGVNMNRDQVNIRGSNGYSYGVGSRVMLLVDGVPYITGDTQGASFESIPVNHIERVEIQKGAGSTLYGSNALGGVINILTKQISEQPDIQIQLYGGIYDRPYYEQWNWSAKARYISGIRADFSQKINSTGLRFSFVRDEDDSYRKNDWQLRYNIAGKLEYDLSPYDHVSISANFMDQNRENFLYWKNLDRALEPAEDQLGEQAKSQRYFIAPVYRKVLKNKKFYKLSAIWYHNRFKDNIGLTGNSSDADYGNIEFQYNLFLGSHFVTTGITPSYSAVSSDIFGSREGYILAAYVQDELKLNEQWRFTFGIRFDYFNIDELRSDNSISPKAGVVYKPAPGSAYRASFGSGFRAPSMAEAFTSTTAGGLIVQPNKNLKPEHSISAEAGWNRIFSTYVMTDIALFYNYYWDLIEGGFIEDENQLNNFIRFDNITEARVFGAEASLNWQILRDKLIYRLGYTYTNSRDIKAGMDLKYRPEHLLYHNIRYRMGIYWFSADYRYLSRFNNIDQTFAQIIPDAEERVPVHVVDLRISADLRFQETSLEVSLQLNNLFQYNYVDVIGTLAPVRNYVLTLKASL
jgi:iron complex outermembrane receptor protein